MIEDKIQFFLSAKEINSFYHDIQSWKAKISRWMRKLPSRSWKLKSNIKNTEERHTDFQIAQAQLLKV